MDYPGCTLYKGVAGSWRVKKLPVIRNLGYLARLLHLRLS